jgi:signal transduction histidine kinase
MILIQGGAAAGRGQRARKRGEPKDLAAIGEVAAGIAHDMNNRLAVILGQTQLLRRTASLDPAVDRKLEKIEQEALRSSTMMRGLLERSRSEPAQEPVAINTVVARALDLVKVRPEQTIDLELDLSDNAPVIVGDGEQLAQVLVHLLSNALDAMPETGRLTVRTGITDDSLEISVTDTGSGIDPEQVSRIFEPFFTTKVAGQGTGLGLFLTLHILKNHGGSITVDTAPGRGTTMLVRLPRGLNAAPALAVVK